MVLQEAMIGGTVFLEYDDEEMKLEEKDRVAFDYRALTNREKIDLMYKTKGSMNGADVCLVAVTKVRNLFEKDKVTALDTIEKMLGYKDAGNEITNMLVIVGSEIWRRQSGEEVGLKN